MALTREATRQATQTSKRVACNDMIVSYWDERSSGYSDIVVGEFESDARERWRRVLAGQVEGVRDGAQGAVSALDLGCGPGFFTALLTAMGCHVDAVDTSGPMIERAQENVARYGEAARARFRVADIASLPFDSDTFDLIVMRNVTWLMRDPERAYREWHRVLRPGGRLVLFDANWYRYLIDERIDRARRLDQLDPKALERTPGSWANDDQERRSEIIALALPLTYELRPAWDLLALKRVGFSHVSADERIVREVWSQAEQRFYASSPLFMVAATK